MADDTPLPYSSRANGTVVSKSWQICDALYSAKPHRSPDRYATRHIWQPSGSGCTSLLPEGIPTMQDVVRRFCLRRAGSSILFVGDSTQGQLFQSFASILGANRLRRPRVTVTEDEASWAGSNAWCNPNEAETEDGRFYHQLESVCPTGDVTLRFVRNDLSVLDERHTTKGNQFSLRSFNSTAMCDWSDAARTADLIVFNRGAHYVDDESFLAGLHDTISRLATLLRGRGRTLSKAVVYRSTLAAIPNCSHQPRDPAPTALHDLIVANGAAYRWDQFEHQNQLAKRVMERQGVPFLNIYHALSFRPGGHRPGFGGKGHDCMHFCLPGPLDEMAKLLQMFWSI